MAESSQIEVWVDAARRGEPLAVSKLLAAFHPMLRARAEARLDQSLRARLEPEDLLQQVYIDVFRRISQFEDRAPNAFLNWVLTILDSRVVDARRREHRRVRDIAREIDAPRSSRGASYWNLLDQLYADSPTPSGVIRHEEAVGALLACLSHLEADHRQVLEMRYIEGLSVSDAAERLGRSDAAVVALTSRALKSLRGSMDHLGEFTRV